MADIRIVEALLKSTRAGQPVKLEAFDENDLGRASSKRWRIRGEAGERSGRTVLLPADDAAEYERHIQAFAAEYAPVGLRESDLVQSIADTWWRLKRIPCLESALLAQGYLEFADSFDEYDPSLRPSLIQAQAFLKYEKQLRNLQLQEARLFRRYEKDRAELRELQQARKQKEAEALSRQRLTKRTGQSVPPSLASNFQPPNSSKIWTASKPIRRQPEPKPPDAAAEPRQNWSGCCSNHSARETKT